jgi:hypothetical protein
MSLQELIGHCSAVYNVNRATVLALEQHLAQYGYQQPANAVLEPESLQSCMQDNTDGKTEPAPASEIVVLVCFDTETILVGFSVAAVCSICVSPDSHHAVEQCSELQSVKCMTRMGLRQC